MLPVVISLTLAAANAANIVASTVPGGAGNLSLVSPTTVVGFQPTAAGPGMITYTPTITLDVARRVLVTYGNEVSNRTIKISGGDRAGNIISETLTVVSGAGGTVSTQQDFLTVTGVTVYASWTQALTVGTSSTGSSQWIVVQNNITPFNLGLNFNVTPTVTGQIDATYMNPNQLPTGLIVPDSFQPISAITTTANNSITNAIVAYRLTITSGTGTIRMSASQSGNYGG